jgi:hypothetical protein
MTRETGSPFRWAEFLLERLLPSEDRQTVTGDLREEYAEAIFPRKGRLRADLWYLFQVASFVPRCVFWQTSTRKALLFASLLMLSCCIWLAFMESRLQHPGYLPRIAMDISLALVPLATLLVLLLHAGIRTERWLRIAGIVLIIFAIQTLVRDARSEHFEGFVLIISLAVVLQGGLMLVSLGRIGAVLPPAERKASQ